VLLVAREGQHGQSNVAVPHALGIVVVVVVQARVLILAYAWLLCTCECLGIEWKGKRGRHFFYFSHTSFSERKTEATCCLTATKCSMNQSVLILEVNLQL